MLQGCMTLSGHYAIDIYNDSGELINKKMKLMTEGSGIYTVINGACRAYPKSVIVITDIKTNEELKSESPHKCR